MPEEISVIAISKEEGVNDLPVMVRANFAKALRAEREGNKEEAERWLQEAIDKEQEIKNRNLK